MENTEISIEQIVEHRNENFKLLVFIKSMNDSSVIYDKEFIEKLENKIRIQDEQIRLLDISHLYTTNEI